MGQNIDEILPLCQDVSLPLNPQVSIGVDSKVLPYLANSDGMPPV